MKNRRVLYYIPLISVSEVVEFFNFSIKPFSGESDYSDLLPEDMFCRNGSLLEVSGFASGGYFQEGVDSRVFDAVERVKFGYFLLNPSHTQDSRGYVSSETFECFRILEKNQDPSFEHKVHFSNGMFNFSESLKTYYGARRALGQKCISVNSDDFFYVDYLCKDVSGNQQLAAMKLFNRCWSTYSIHNQSDKALLARVSVEVLVKAIGSSKTIFVDLFFEKVLDRIKIQAKSSRLIDELLSQITPRLGEVKAEIEKNILNLKDARDKFAHDGVEDLDHINVPFYLVWFPIFWMVFLKSDEISEKEGIRLVLFFCLLNFKVQDWQKIEFSMSVNSKMTHLSMYSHYSRVLPVDLKRQSKETIDASLKGIVNWLQPLCS